MTSKLPVTVLTGFLGSGKTTLLNRILTENHGLRIAVIENEFGEVGIDHELVINADEEIFEMNNGCICCTVRGDLIRIIGSLMKRRDQFDHILIETTGLADPGPVIQTFFVDDEMKDKLALNAIIALVDARHIGLHLDSSEEAVKQIAFADSILLNKTDLATPAELDALEARVKAINGVAKLQRCQNANVPIASVLDIGGFNLDRSIGIDPRFLDPEYPFEWGGIFDAPAGTLTLEASKKPDPSMTTVIIPVSGTDDESLALAREVAMRAFSPDAIGAPSGHTISADGIPYDLILRAGSMNWTCEIVEPGPLAIFTQHYPEELGLLFLTESSELQPLIAASYKPDHSHDETVTSVGIEADGECDARKLDAWLSKLLRERGTDIYRMKGVFAIKGNPNRFIFQGVHMLLDPTDGGPWGYKPRRSSLVFIGRDLDRDELNQSFRKCLA
ncbi:MAG: GTP-binding protein [Luteolibacter sp.]|jgi:G3E family GTPase|nr:GTP-binding protein [Luteolibacter sp.]